MKTFYNKILSLKILKLPALIFFLLALSYNVRAQYALPPVVCDGQPIQLFCGGLPGCGVGTSTFTWVDEAGTWYSNDENPVIFPGSPGYHGGQFYLSIQYLPEGLSSGVASVVLLTPFSVSGTITPLACNGASTGAITITPNGGQPSYGPYAWSNGKTTKDITGLSAGTYTVTVTDANNCTASRSFTINAPIAISISGSQTNVVCNGSSTGSITTTVSGGAPSYSYLWNTGGTASSINNLSVGTYTVSVTDQNNCTATKTFTITQTNAMSVTFGGTNISCFGGNNGAISTTVTGGTSGYTYNWSNGGTTRNISGLTAGTYFVTITDFNLCTKTSSFAVTQPSDITVSGTPVNIVCFGNLGQITANVSGGSGGLTSYLWNNGQTAATATGLTAGSYTVTVTNAAGCTKSNSFQITSNSAISFGTVNIIAATCNTSNNGSIQLFASGGVTPYGYLWNNGQTGSTATALTAGTYSVTLTDGVGCTKVGSWTVTSPSAISITDVKTNVLCNGQATGKIDITVAGGTPGYTYNWNVLGYQGQGTPNVSGLATGTYTVTVTDVALCTATKSWTITAPTALSGNGIVTNVTCYGGNNGTATITGFGGTSPYAYHWITGSNSQLITGLSVGRYFVTITDANSCPNFTWQDISQPSDITITGTPVKVVCQGTSTGSIIATTSGGSGGVTSYLWNNGQTASTAVNLSAGTYTVTITNEAGCTKSKSFVVDENPAISFGSVIKTDAKCSASPDGSIQLFVSGGISPYSYNWSNGQHAATATGLIAGTYTVTVTDNGSCTKVGSWTINAPSAITMAGLKTDVLCNGQATGKIDITVGGGTPGYTYNWNVLGYQGQGTPHVSALNIGTYTVTVTDLNLCTAVQSWTINQPTALSGNGVVTNVTCYGGNNGTATITGFGGTSPYTYHWITGSNSQLITGLSVGRYYVTITDNNNCPNFTWQDISQPSDITISGTPTLVVCNGSNTGSIIATTSGGSGGLTSYLWNNGQTTSTAINLTAGTYTVTVTNEAGCTKSKSFVVNENPVITFGSVIKTDAKCNTSADGSIQLFVSGGVSPYSYNWNNGQHAATATGLIAGTYTVTVTDYGSCPMVGSWTINAPSEITITGIKTDVLCNGQATGKIDITVGGGTPGYTYNWNVLGYQGQGTAHVSALNIGTYTVTVTDLNLCTSVKSWTIAQPTALSGNGVVTNVTCYGGNNGTATITGFGGTSPYTYHWITGSNSQLITGLSVGRYYVTITDNNNCPNFTWQDISQPSDITISGTPTLVVCNGSNTGSIIATTSGGSGGLTSYLWNNGQTTSTAVNLTAGTYTVTVTNEAGCTKSKSFVVNENPAISFGSVIKTDAKCNTSPDGSIQLFVSGGVSPYTYNWSNGQSAATATGLIAGTYTVTVTDYGSCPKVDSWTINAPSAITITGLKTDVLCNGQATGKIDITVGGGTPGYTYNWNVLGYQGQGTAHVSALNIGTYTVTVTDLNLCTSSQSWTISQPTALSGNGVVTNVTCYGGNNGTATITGFGGTPPYAYHWITGSNAQLITGLSVGRYHVTITDANSCPNFTWQDITQPSDITVLGTPVIVVCNGSNTGSIIATTSGGSGGLTSYLWNNGQTTSTAINLTAGTYTVTVTNEAGCTKSKSFVVGENPALSFGSVINTPAKCFSSADGSIQLFVSGGVTPYSYYWNNGQTASTATGLTAGTYSVTLTDGGNCTKIGSWTVTAPTEITLTVPSTVIPCYGYSNGTLTANVSGGTPGYNYVWNTGGTTSTITGLSAGLYFVTVTDANSCVKSASASVTQPAGWSVDIEGPLAACCNSNVDSQYDASVSGQTVGDNCEGAVTYEWVVIGGTITSGWNTAHITVDWACCTQGSVTVTATRCDGCTVSKTIFVAVNLPPAPVITGPISVSANQAGTTYCTPDFPGHLYTWTVVGGSVTGGQGTHCITVTWGPFPPCGCGTVTVCETNTLTGCSDCTTLNITILPEGPNLDGYVMYQNPPYNTELNGVTVKLRNPSTGTIVATTVTGPNMNLNPPPPHYPGEPGYFAFTNVPAGTYILESSFNGAWGGNNATDALIVQLYTVGQYTLTGLPLIVADVNQSLGANPVTALDALYIKLRTIGMISSYPAGDWKFTSPSVTITGPSLVAQDIWGLCVGDVNASYVPTGLKEASFLSSVNDGVQTVPVNGSFTYDLKSNSSADLGAMTLFMDYDQSLFEIENVNTSLEGLKYAIENGKVALAWSDTKSLSVKNGETLLSLTMKAKEPLANATRIFNVLPGSEFSDTRANRFDNFELKMSDVVTPSGAAFNMMNYPNPFRNTTTISYTLPESGKVHLVLTNMFGQTMKVLVDEMQNAGTYNVTVNPVDYNLTPGVYLYKIEVAGATDTFVKVNKMMLTK